MYIAVCFVTCKFNVYSTRVKVYPKISSFWVLSQFWKMSLNVTKIFRFLFSRVCSLVSFSCQKYLSSALVFLNWSSRHNFALSIIVSQDDHYFDDILESLFKTGVNTDVVSIKTHKHCFWMKFNQFT